MPSAVEKEAAWLATSGDSLPALLATAGGPFSVVQAYWPRTPQTRKTGLYVLRSAFTDVRFSNQRRLRRHQLSVRVVWPIGHTTTGTTIWETEQEALDTAVDQVVARVVAFVGDKTHGGRFLSVAEAPETQPISVRFSDPERNPQAGQATLSAEITYSADDNDYTA